MNKEEQANFNPISLLQFPFAYRKYMTENEKNLGSLLTTFTTEKEIFSANFWSV